MLSALRLGIRARRGRFAASMSSEASTFLDGILPERVADFPSRHIGPRKEEAKHMLAAIGYKVRRNFYCI